MNSYELADKLICPFLDNVSHEIVYADIVSDDFVKFGRQSPSFDNNFIDKRPLYDVNNHKITDILRYMQHLVCWTLEGDLKGQSNGKLKILKLGQLSDGYFYSLDIPLIIWEIKADQLDRAVSGHVWVEKSTVTG